MIKLRGTLLPDHILLNLDSGSRDEAIRRVAETLRSDTRVADWPRFFRTLKERDANAKINLQYGVTVPHARTSSVTGMVMAFGRLKEPVAEPDGMIHFVTVLGIPGTMDAEYLRLVGTLMRVFRSEKLRRRLQQAEKPSQIVDIFEQGESGLYP
ncbi:MAG TPA: PTS sugar transporter subunit IIA [Chthoniobacterales bacterium]|jgi:PTS system fructose-specific IIC component|nr:PTS sugar transporter subunit IIA [Chthoniobacterales bacterium]